ncbi:hypothetical protein [Candidatus Entotheonella palauensis]|uniref:Uncharacterized protein n=1 Tax=Candidatus Entotheonella gemina TaxID=1429439 RepID=W4MEU9_9BACT|nr:hypothetical protein [Candidatus Entotheonella palauensis]ETX08733.1 MAG: hypothetical protein ETSY2_03610 [Candidatus Entotheonella gemina]
MPNILAHCGVQGILTHALIKDAPPAWITVGCLIPDMPWILVRIVSEVIPNSAVYDLRAYAIVQATLGFSLLLSAGFARLSPRPGFVFRILALNVVLHLLLDASQIKWANGVHFFAPFSWTLLNWGWFWPESRTTILCTVMGVIYLLSAMLHQSRFEPTPPSSRTTRWTLAAVCIVAYFLLPFVFWHGPYDADNHFIKTLRERDTRAGRYIEMDRADYVPQAEGASVFSLVGEGINVQGPPHDPASKISVKGVFLDAATIRIDRLQVHWPRFRDGASYMGLIWLSVLWFKSWWQMRTASTSRLD